MARPKNKSKKPSAAKPSSHKLLSGTTFFLDESILCADLRQGLLAAGATVTDLPTHFPRGTPDEVWLEEVGKHGWVVLTKDTRIRHRPLERETYKAHKAKVFVFTGGEVKGATMAAVISAKAMAMAQRAVSVQAPFIFGIAASGKLTRID